MTVAPRRVLVALDASAGGRAALEAAVRWAGADDREVVALFVEDEDLLRLAAWPGALVFPGRGGAPRAVDAVAMASALRGAADRAREVAAEVTTRTRVRVRFEWARGRVVPTLLEAAREAELVVLGRRARPSPRAALGATASALAARLPAVVLLDEGETLAPPVVVVDDGTPAARAARAFGAALAPRLAPGGAAAWHVVRIADAATPDVRTTGAVGDAFVTRRRDPEGVAAVARGLGARTTVLPRSLATGPDGAAFVAAMPGAVVVVDVDGGAAPAG